MPARRFMGLAAAALLLGLAACAPQQAAPPIYGSLDRQLPAALIHEGSPVFLIAGVLKPVAGASLTGATLRAVGLDGKPLDAIQAGALGADGAFALGGPITSALFFAEAGLSSGAKLRTVLRAEPGSDFVVDAATSAMASKIALAAQAGRSFDAFDPAEAGRLTSQARAGLGAKLDALPFAGDDATLGQAFSALAEKEAPAFAYRLANWERALNGQAPLPSPSPSASPSAGASPSPSAGPSGPVPK